MSPPGRPKGERTPERASAAGKSTSARVPRAASGFAALSATLAIQIYTSVTAAAVAVLAPVLASDFGIAPSWIGVFIGLLYVGAMTGSLASGELVGRYGAIRVSQACVVLCAVGMVTMAALPATGVMLFALTAVLMGMGYGPITVASSEVLVRTTRPDRMALTFSIKQTGVPAGTAIAGALLPAAALAFGWRGAFVAVAVAGVFVAASSEPVRRALDLRHAGRGPVTLTSLLAPLAMVIRTPRLFELSLTGLGFASVQVSITSFLVVYLTDALGWSLVAAGLALTCVTVAAVPGRIVWGIVADRTRRATQVLVTLGVVSALCGVAFACAQPSWPAWVLLPLATVYGFTAIGWNGVQISEVARRAPAGAAAAATGGSGFITFSGVMLGPMVFGVLAALTGGYRASFMLCAATSALAAAFLLRRHRQRGGAHPSI